MRPTLSDVAKLAGVSVATASRALSNPDLVADGTRRAVRDAAASCGYKINLVARSLRIQRTDTLLVLAPCIDNSFYPGLVRSIEESALAMGYAIIVGFTRKTDKYREAYGELLSAGRVDGMAVMDGGSGVDRFTGPRPDLPVVQVFDQIYESPVPVVRVDEQQVADLAVHQLASMGHRRIAHIAGAADSPSARQRRDGYAAAMARLPVPAGRSRARSPSRVTHWPPRPGTPARRPGIARARARTDRIDNQPGPVGIGPSGESPAPVPPPSLTGPGARAPNRHGSTLRRQRAGAGDERPVTCPDWGR